MQDNSLAWVFGVGLIIVLIFNFIVIYHISVLSTEVCQTNYGYNHGEYFFGTLTCYGGRISESTEIKLGATNVKLVNP